VPLAKPPLSDGAIGPPNFLLVVRNKANGL
jgi:hypothetical protein